MLAYQEPQSLAAEGSIVAEGLVAQQRVCWHTSCSLPLL